MQALFQGLIEAGGFHHHVIAGLLPRVTFAQHLELPLVEGIRMMQREVGEHLAVFTEKCRVPFQVGRDVFRFHRSSLLCWA